MALVKQYINLPLDHARNHGRWHWLVVSVTETKDGASAGQPLLLKLEPDGKNMTPGFVAAGNRATGFAFVPPNRKLVAIEDKKGKSWVRLSTVGGDKFGFKAGKWFLAKFEIDHPDTVEIWRKIFVRYGKMAGAGAPPIPVANFGTVKGELEKVFIELETEGPSNVAHVPWVTGQDPLRSLDRGKPAMEFPDQSASMVFVDRIGKRSNIDTRTFTFTAEQMYSNFTWQLPGGVYTWPDDADWISGTITIKDGKGKTLRTVTDVERLKVTIKKDKATGYKHPEGWATRGIRFVFSKWGGKGYFKKLGGTVDIKLRIGTIDDTAMGLAWSSPPAILIATHHPYTFAASGGLENTVVHELGHVLGLNVRWLGDFNPDSGALEDFVDNDSWYDDTHGGRGPHCSTGASLAPKLQSDGTTRQEYKNGTCAMLHYANGITTFCDKCQRMLKLARLEKLGREKVWPLG